jgi:hypothetical protein
MDFWWRKLVHFWSASFALTSDTMYVHSSWTMHCGLCIVKAGSVDIKFLTFFLLFEDVSLYTLLGRNLQKYVTQFWSQWWLCITLTAPSLKKTEEQPLKDYEHPESQPDDTSVLETNFHHIFLLSSV